MTDSFTPKPLRLWQRLAQALVGKLVMIREYPVPSHVGRGK